MSNFENLIFCILSPDKSIREQGEKLLDENLKAAFPLVLHELLETAGAADENIAGLATVLLRKKVIESELYELIPIEQKQATKTKLLSLVSPVRSILYLKRLADLILNLAVNENWANELFSMMTNWAQDFHSTIKQFSMYFFELICVYESLIDLVKPNASSVMGILEEIIQHHDLEVKLTAAKTVPEFLLGINDEQLAVKYEECIDIFLSLIEESLKQDFSYAELCAGCLTSISQLANYPQMWKDKIEVAVEAVSKIVEIPRVPEFVRAASVEILSALIVKTPVVVSKSVYFLEESLTLGFMLIAEVEHPFDDLEWNAELESNVVEQDSYSLGKDLVAKLAQCDQSAVFSLIVQLVYANLQANHWVRQHTGLIAIGLISEGCEKSLAECLPQVFSQILPFGLSDSPRVRWATLSTISVLCRKYLGTFQQTYHREILMTVLACLSPENYSKVQYEAAVVLVNFSVGLERVEEILTPYIPSIYQAFFILLSGNEKFNYLTKQILETTASISTLIGEEIVKYYSEFSPGLRNIIGSTPTRLEEKAVRAAAIECIACMVSQQPVEEVLLLSGEFLQLKSTLDDSDPGFYAILESWPMLAKAARNSFEPYLDEVVPEILSYSEEEIEFKISDAESSESLDKKKGEVCFDFEWTGQGDKKLYISSSIFEKKRKSVEVIFFLMEYLKNNYSKFVFPTIEVFKTLLNYKFNSEIRKTANKIVRISMNCCDTEQQKETLLLLFLPWIQTAIESSYIRFPEDSNIQLKTLEKSMEKVENLAIIGLSNAHSLSQTLSKILTELSNRKITYEELYQYFTDEIVYADEIEAIENSQKEDTKILKRVIEIIALLLKSFKESFHSVFSSLFTNYFGEILYRKNATEDEILIAICAFDDLIEYTGDLLTNNNGSPLIEKLIEFCYHPNEEIRQSASYGLGIAATQGNFEVFSHYKDLAVGALEYILNLQGAQTEFLVSSECAAGALGKIGVKFDLGLVPYWISWLPFKSDPEEARSMHKFFLENLSAFGMWKREVLEVLEEMRFSPEEYFDEETWASLPVVMNGFASEYHNKTSLELI